MLVAYEDFIVGFLIGAGKISQGIPRGKIETHTVHSSDAKYQVKMPTVHQAQRISALFNSLGIIH